MPFIAGAVSFFEFNDIGMVFREEERIEEFIVETQYFASPACKSVNANLLV